MLQVLTVLAGCGLAASASGQTCVVQAPVSFAWLWTSGLLGHIAQQMISCVDSCVGSVAGAWCSLPPQEEKAADALACLLEC